MLRKFIEKMYEDFEDYELTKNKDIKELDKKFSSILKEVKNIDKKLGEELDVLIADTVAKYSEVAFEYGVRYAAKFNYVICKDYSEKIEDAKQEAIALRIKEKKFIENNDFGKFDMELNPNKWYIGQWETGFVICDAEQLKKMPKSKRDKILSLGGVKSKL